MTAAVPHVVIVGAGFGGLAAARALAAAPVRTSPSSTGATTISSSRSSIRWRRRACPPSEIAQPIRAIVRGQANAAVLLGEVTDRRRGQGGAAGGAAHHLRPSRAGDRRAPRLFRPAGCFWGRAFWKHTDVAAEITGHVARVTLTQTFENPNATRSRRCTPSRMSHRARLTGCPWRSGTG